MQASSASAHAFLCPCSARTHRNLQSSAFSGVSFKPTLRSFTLSRGARRSLTVVAVLKGNSNVEGVVILAREEGGPTTVNVRVTGLTPGPHRFHLLYYLSLLEHISTPNNMTHGAPEDEISHSGDLGNIIANADGVAEATILDRQIPLSGPNSVVGKAFMSMNSRMTLERVGMNLVSLLEILEEDWLVIC